MKEINIHYSQEVQDAKKKGKAIVALESTIITHGMPYPENKDTALLVEETVRANDACPASIAIIDGAICVGLDEKKLESLAKESAENPHNVLKVSTKDIPYAVIQKYSGGTTVAATMYIAHRAGISVFATGGIGGVHRGAETSFDISADLDELAHTPLTIVCAGAKSILDLRLTLEYLETKAVPVIGYNCMKLPAFYTRTSEHSLDISLNTPEQIAEFMCVQWAFSSLVQNRQKGIIIANPIPEQYSMDEAYISSLVEDALTQCEAKGITGKACTPFLLAYIAEKSEKKSLFSNIGLVKNNATLAAKIAVKYMKLLG